MNFLPIVARELQVRSRRTTLHWARCGIVGLSLLTCLQSFQISGGAVTPGQSGQMAYSALAIIAFALAWLGGLLTADSLSSERREGTLGFLFLTDLKGYDVVLGKLTAMGVGAFYTLLAFAPALALPLLAGGVQGGEIFRMTLAVLNTLWLSLAAGMWISARARSQHHAWRGAVILMLMLTVGPWLLGNLLAPLSPQFTFRTTWAVNYRVAPERFWWSLLSVHLEGWILLGWATYLAVRGWRDNVGLNDKTVSASPPAPDLTKSRQGIGRFGPVGWRAKQLPGQTALVWGAFLLSSAGGWLWMNIIIGRATSSAYFSGLIGLQQGLSLVARFGSAALFAWAAARFFFEARRSGELELLLSTPVGAQRVLAEQWQIHWRRLRWPLLLFVLSGFMRDAVQGMFPNDVFHMLWNMSSTVIGLLSIMADSWMGMYAGLRFRRPVVGIAWVVGLVHGLPWIGQSIIYSLARKFLGGSLFWSNGGKILGSLLTFGVPLLLLGLNIFYVCWARVKLRAALRLTPQKPSRPGPPLAFPGAPPTISISEGRTS